MYSAATAISRRKCINLAAAAQRLWSLDERQLLEKADAFKRRIIDEASLSRTLSADYRQEYVRLRNEASHGIVALSHMLRAIAMSAGAPTELKRTTASKQLERLMNHGKIWDATVFERSEEYHEATILFATNQLQTAQVLLVDALSREGCCGQLCAGFLGRCTRWVR